MVNFAAKHFRKVMELILWVNIIGCTIIGWNIGGTIGVTHSFGRSSGDGHPVIGLLLGLLIGVLTSITYGGLVAVFLNIHGGIKNINKWLQCMWEHNVNINPDEKKKLPPTLNDDYIYYFE